MIRMEQYQMAGNPFGARADQRPFGSASKEDGSGRLGRKDPREVQRPRKGPERPREAQRDPEGPREAQRGPERSREAKRSAQRGPERLSRVPP